jgi:hypothetical protein
VADNVLCVPDLHCPWHHAGALDFLADLKRQYKPRHVVFMGDEIDGHRWSRHAQSPEMPGPGEELRLAALALKPFYRLFPEVMVCWSNHTLRPFKKAAEGGLPRPMLREIRDILGAPAGWRWRHFWDIGGVHFRHGDGFSGKNAALTAAERIRKNVVIGHVHSHAGVQYASGPFDRLWGMNVGCLVDADAEAFAYARYMASRPTLGAGVLLGGQVPLFVPLDGPPYNRPKAQARRRAA